MALLDSDKLAVARRWAQREFVNGEAVANMHLNEIVEAVTAIDGWWDAAPGAGASNQASIIAILPLTFKNSTSSDQKISLLTLVLERRQGLPLS